ncbi:MAG TPA: ribose ABC transporter permease [Terriglobia bacterium]|nr:ribose ABC transporter permease [Terriglobia bacterium]
MGAEFRISRTRQIGTLSGLLSLCFVLWILSPYFLTVSNLLNIAEQTSIIAVVAAGMTFVIITAGIDLSVGSVLAFSGVVMASSLAAGRSIPLALAIGLAAGLLCGIGNGVLISIGRLPPFIATLGMMSIARGAALMFTQGRPISGFSETFRSIANTDVLRVPFPVIVMIGVYVVSHLVLARTKLGRYAYAIGGNETAAHLSGVNVRLYKTAVYALSGMCSALAAVLLTARLNSAQPIAGINYELDAIAAVVIGGTSLMGGEGTVSGTLIGALIIGVLRNGLNLLAVSSFIQQIVIGSVIVIAVLLDTFFKRRGK